MSRLPVKKTYKLYIGGAFPRSESGPHLPRRGPERRARLPQGPPRRRPRRPRRAARLGRARPPTTAARSLYRIAEMMEARRADLAAALLRARGGRPLDRPCRLVRGLGRQARPGARRHEPRRRPVLQLHDPRADRRRRHPRAGRAGARGRSSRASRPRSSAATRPSSSPPRRHPLAAIELAEVLATSDVPGGVVNILTGHRDELAPWLAGHMDVNAIDVTGADGLAPSSRGSPPRT